MSIRSDPRDGVNVEIDPARLRQLLADAREFDRKLSAALRKRLRVAGEIAARDVRARVEGGEYTQNVGLRAGIAAGVRVGIRTGAKSAGVVITASPSKLPAAKAAMVKAFNKKSFRHPDFGDRGVWVEQAGRPYFGAVIAEHAVLVRVAVDAALRDAARTIRAGQVMTT